MEEKKGFPTGNLIEALLLVILLTLLLTVVVILAIPNMRGGVKLEEEYNYDGTFENFEKSQYCQYYGCFLENSISNKNYHMYTMNNPDIGVEIILDGGKFANASITLFNYDGHDLIRVLEFIYTINPDVTPNINRTMYIKDALNRRAEQICLSDPQPFGNMTMWVGRVQVPQVTVGYSCPKSPTE